MIATTIAGDGRPSRIGAHPTAAPWLGVPYDRATAGTGTKTMRFVAAMACAAVALGAAAAAAGGGPANRRVAIYSSLPERDGWAWQALAIERGARMALADAGGRVGAHHVVFKRLDDSLASTGAADEGRAERNARRAANDHRTIGYIGEYNSYASAASIPILNRAGIAQISPTNTYVGLTTKAPGHAPGDPGRYYPTGRRTYARVQPNDSVQAAALVTVARGHGCASVHVFNSGTYYSRGLSTTFARTAKAVGLKVRRVVTYDPDAHAYRSLAAKVKSPCVVQTGEIELHGARLLRDVHHARPHARLYGADGVCINVSDHSDLGVPRSVAKRYRCTLASLAPGAYPPAGRAFFKRYFARYGEAHFDPYAINGYESMALMLSSAKRALGPGGGLKRRGVVAALFATRNRHSVLGKYSIDRHGDTTLRDYGLYRLRKGRLHFARKVASVKPVVGR
jgi:branched-chain amino acid transport system substrate-binding protein